MEWIQVGLKSEGFHRIKYSNLKIGTLNRKFTVSFFYLYFYRNETDYQNQINEILKQAIDYLTLIPQEASKPVLQIKELSIKHSEMPFTTEEFAFCQNLKESQASVWKAIPLPMEVMEELIYRTNALANLVPKTLIEKAKNTVVNRYLAFADKLNQIQVLSFQSQFYLQTINLKFLIFVDSAFAAKQMSMQQQINYAVHANVTKEVSKDTNIPKIQWDKIYPWMAENHPLFHLIQNFQAMELDHYCVILIIGILIFNAPKNMEMKEIQQAQKHFKLVLYRYLCSKMSKSGAVLKMEEIEQFLSELLTSQNCPQLA